MAYKNGQVIDAEIINKAIEHSASAVEKAESAKTIAEAAAGVVDDVVNSLEIILKIRTI